MIAFIIVLDEGLGAGGACAHVGISLSCVNCQRRLAQSESHQNGQHDGDDFAFTELLLSRNAIA